MTRSLILFKLFFLLNFFCSAQAPLLLEKISPGSTKVEEGVLERLDAGLFELFDSFRQFTIIRAQAEAGGPPSLTCVGRLTSFDSVWLGDRWQLRLGLRLQFSVPEGKEAEADLVAHVESENVSEEEGRAETLRALLDEVLAKLLKRKNFTLGLLVIGLKGSEVILSPGPRLLRGDTLYGQRALVRYTASGRGQLIWGRVEIGEALALQARAGFQVQVYGAAIFDSEEKWEGGLGFRINYAPSLVQPYFKVLFRFPSTIDAHNIPINIALGGQYQFQWRFFSLGFNLGLEVRLVVRRELPPSLPPMGPNLGMQMAWYINRRSEVSLGCDSFVGIRMQGGTSEALILVQLTAGFRFSI